MREQSDKREHETAQADDSADVATDQNSLLP